MTTTTSFSGRSRRRETRWSVRITEVLSRLCITIGGLGTILAVLLVFVFLVFKVVNLFLPARVLDESNLSVETAEARPLRVVVDEDKLLTAILSADGTLRVYRLDTGKLLEERKLFERERITAVSSPGRTHQFALGLANGEVRFGEIGFDTRFVGSYRLTDFGIEELRKKKLSEAAGEALKTLKDKDFTSEHTFVASLQKTLSSEDLARHRDDILKEASVLRSDEVPASLKQMKSGEIVEHDTGLATRTPDGNLRLHQLVVSFQPPVAPLGKKKVMLLDAAIRKTGTIFTALAEDNTLSINTVSQPIDPLTDAPLVDETGKPVLETSGGTIVLPAHNNTSPKYLLVSELGDAVFVGWEDGRLLRVNSANPRKAKVVETIDLLENEDATLTTLQFAIGKTTLLVGDSRGRISAWFSTKGNNPRGSDGSTFTKAHDLCDAGIAVTSLYPSARSRMVAAGFADGSVRLIHITSETTPIQRSGRDKAEVQYVLLSPKDDAILALHEGGLSRWDIDPRHPEITVATLLLPVWYEGEAKPKHIWQSASADDAFEPKFGLVPLIFGTLKATFYSLLIAVPAALLAALYTSEFMHPRVKSVLKPSIELMAGLPSVVLGFLAGLVLAPFTERHLTTIVALLITVPICLLIGAHLWNLLPASRRVLFARGRILGVIAALPPAIPAALVLGPALERLLFGRADGTSGLRHWLDTGTGSALPGWFLLLLPLCGILSVFVMGILVNPWLDERTRTWSRRRSALLGLTKFVVGGILAVVLAASIAQILAMMHLDPRGSFLGKYDQKNSLVVGFAMGFAIIPIIYTIADDALTAVPDHLRSASLACGATPWQTAVRVIIPTATGGLFSAVMIGLGRAVGETMIVLMAAGNTPVLDMNVFNGFRTLSANLAVEMPEAVKDSTHQRTLYLGALVLFAMTFVLNTIAESVRLRFRRRAYQL